MYSAATRLGRPKPTSARPKPPVWNNKPPPLIVASQQFPGDQLNEQWERADKLDPAAQTSETPESATQKEPQNR